MGTLEGMGLGIEAYLGMILSLIEGRHVSREEVQELLERIVRQHSFAQGQGVDYDSREDETRPP